VEPFFAKRFRLVSGKLPYIDYLRGKGRHNRANLLAKLEYAPIAEILGAVALANISMNCSAPDTGNMEVLEKFGTHEQKERYLEPLLNGEIRSCFAMTEPGVASSDATNISTTIMRQENGTYIVHGHKFYISGAIPPECKIALVLGRSRNDGPRHARQTMAIVPMDAPGVKILRAMEVFGHAHDHAEMVFDNVVIPAENIILGEGRGFEIAQGRLGPGRIHHAMRTIGVAEVALQSIIHRSRTRHAFGSVLSEKEGIRRIVAEARLEITQIRQLCYLAAVVADEKGFKEARKYIAMIKVAAPRAALKIVDDAIQVHGAHGLSQDSRLSEAFMGLRTLRVADGPDSVHLATISALEFGASPSIMGILMSGENKNINKYGMFSDVKPEEKKKKSARDPNSAKL
jgi:acyl-CoA dehydrogenase